MKRLSVWNCDIILSGGFPFARKNKWKWWKCVWFQKEEKFWALLREEPLGRREWEVRTAKGGGRGCFAFVGFWNSVGSQMQIESRERREVCFVLCCFVWWVRERERENETVAVGLGLENRVVAIIHGLVRVDIMLASITLEWNYITIQQHGTTLLWFGFCSVTLHCLWRARILIRHDWRLRWENHYEKKKKTSLELP